MDLAEMRRQVRRDLRDEDPGEERWSDAELDRHIARAVREASLASPREAKTTLTATPDSRELDVSGLADRVSIDAVEFPTGSFPPSYVRFSVWGDTLTMLLDSAPSSADDVGVLYGALHTLDGSSSTLPAELEDAVATGAAGFAALAWASFATNRLNVGGDDTWRRYLVLGQERQASFARALAEHGRKGSLRARQLYTPAGEPPIQSTGLRP